MSEDHQRKVVLVIAPNMQIFLDSLQLDFAKGKKITMNRTKGVCQVDDTTFILIIHPDRMRGFHGVEVRFEAMHLLDKSLVNRFQEEANLARLK